MFRDGADVDRDYEHAADLFERACDNDIWSACVELGAAFEKGHGRTRDPARAAALFSSACDHRDGEGCRSLGALYARGAGVHMSRERSFDLYRRGCALGTRDACFEEAVRIFQGDGTQKDEVEGEKRLDDLCRAAHWGGCYQLAELRTWRDDFDGARAPYATACEAGRGDACRQLAVAEEKLGASAARTHPLRTRAREILTPQCERGRAWSCWHLARMYERGEGVSVDVDRAMQLDRRACEADHPASCADLGRMMMEAPGGPRDKDDARAVLVHGCDGGRGLACWVLANAMLEGGAFSTDVTAARVRLAQACRWRYDFACGRLADFEMRGWGGPVDVDAAKSHLPRGCHAGWAYACGTLVRMHLRGELRADVPKAIVALKKACAADEANASDCNSYAWTLCVLGRFEDAIPIALRAVAMPDGEKAPLIDTLAVALAGAGRADEAIAAIDVRPQMRAELATRRREIAEGPRPLPPPQP
jgi:uncharacterized protein